MANQIKNQLKTETGYFRKQKIDYILALTVFILVLVGLVMISSASVVASFEKFGNNYHYLTQQLISLAIGSVVWVIVTKIDYQWYQKHSIWFLIISIILLISVFVPGIGQQFGGAHRWVQIGKVFFQPSEIVKLTFIIYLCFWLDQKGKDINDFFKGFLPFILLVGIISGLIMFQPDMGTMSVVLLTSLVLFYLAGASISYLALIIASLGAIFWFLISISSYRMQRFLTFINPTSASKEAIYHISQALIAIGTGGLFGLGFGQSRQKYLYLPEAHTDSIFAIICEELGFLRAGLIILAFIFLFLRGYAIAKRAPDKFSKLLATGITTWFVIQVFINIFSMLGILPMTGVPLPFISYGGSSLIVNLAAVGILLNISKNIIKK